MSPIGSATTLIRSLLLNGFYLKEAEALSRKGVSLQAYRLDLFGFRCNYTIIFADKEVPMNRIRSIKRRAENIGNNIIAIGENQCDQVVWIPPEKFYKQLGGAADFSLLLYSKLPDMFDKLGHRTLPKDLSGSPEDLLEEATKQSLQFMMMSGARRFGQYRAFENVPDGVAFAGDSPILFDAKSYLGGFDLKLSDLRTFSTYVSDFQSRYAQLGKVHSFLVVSGHFKNGRESLDSRRAKFYSMAKTQLCCIDAIQLGKIVERLKSYPHTRSSIDWSGILSRTVLDEKMVTKEIKRVQKDALSKES